MTSNDPHDAADLAEGDPPALIMSDMQKLKSSELGHELRFAHLLDPARALSFPCDAQGHVDLDALSEQARANYFFARTVVGRDFAYPVVRPCAFH